MNIKNLSGENLDIVLEHHNSPLAFSQLSDLRDLDLDLGSVIRHTVV